MSCVSKAPSDLGTTTAASASSNPRRAATTSFCTSPPSRAVPVARWPGQRLTFEVGRNAEVKQQARQVELLARPTLTPRREAPVP